MLTEGIRGADITKGGMEVAEVKDDMGANGVIAGTDAGIDRFGMLPMPRRGIKTLMLNLYL